jgi:cysteine-rich repeat protein
MLSPGRAGQGRCVVNRVTDLSGAIATLHPAALVLLCTVCLVTACGEEAATNDPSDAGVAAQDTLQGDASDSDGSALSPDTAGPDSGEPDAGAPADVADTASDEDATTVADASDVGSELAEGERCGDGVVTGIEECDNGEANSDAVADACRTDCRQARCGDGVVDADETCDDDNVLGGDGCSPQCGAESGAREQEPNDAWNTAQPLSAGTRIVAGLTEFDTDCFRVNVPEGGWIQAVTSSATPDTVCDVDTSIRLFGPTGTQLASDADSGDELCAAIDPASATRARYVTAGDYAVCVEGVARIAVPSYALTIITGNDSCARFEATPEVDNDNDGSADLCDDDDDDDGVVDIADNCPLVPNGAAPATYRVSTGGYIQHWLAAGPFPQTGGAECLPSEESEVGADLGGLAPDIGDPAGSVSWSWQTTRTDRIDLAARFTPNTFQAAWAFAYIVNPDAAPRSVQLRVGSDDGVRVWWNGQEVLESQTCRAIVLDDDIIPVTFQPGVNRLFMKVRNNSGAWGYLARLTDTSGTPIEGLEILPSGSGGTINNQQDSDADGVGDLCDLTP